MAIPLVVFNRRHWLRLVCFSPSPLALALALAGSWDRPLAAYSALVATDLFPNPQRGSFLSRSVDVIYFSRHDFKDEIKMTYNCSILDRRSKYVKPRCNSDHRPICSNTPRHLVGCSSVILRNLEQVLGWCEIPERAAPLPWPMLGVFSCKTQFHLK